MKPIVGFTEVSLKSNESWHQNHRLQFDENHSGVYIYNISYIIEHLATSEPHRFARKAHLQAVPHLCKVSMSVVVGMNGR